MSPVPHGMYTSVRASPPPNIGLGVLVSTTPTIKNLRPSISRLWPTQLVSSASSSIALSLIRHTCRRSSSSILKNGRPCTTVRPSMSCHSGQMPVICTVGSIRSPFTTLAVNMELGVMRFSDGAARIIPRISLLLIRICRQLNRPGCSRGMRGKIHTRFAPMLSN